MGTIQHFKSSTRNTQTLIEKPSKIPMVRLSTVDRAKLMCVKLARFPFPEPKRKSTLFTVRLGHRQWTVSNFSELPFVVRIILPRRQRQQIIDRELQQTTPRVICF